MYEYKINAETETDTETEYRNCWEISYFKHIGGYLNLNLLDKKDSVKNFKISNFFSIACARSQP